MKIALLAWLAAGVVLLVGAASSTALPRPVSTSGIYVVRPDPRLCPSPLCGGYWVSLANHARTRCHDGLLRARCYVAIAVSGSTRKPLVTALPAGSLVRAAIGTWTFDGVGTLGAVVVADAWAPVAAQAASSGRFFRLWDAGIRCIRAPCYWLYGNRLNWTSRTTGSDLDLTATGASAVDLERAQAMLRAPDGLLATGRFVPSTDGGRVFHATRIYFRAKQPRA